MVKDVIDDAGEARGFDLYDMPVALRFGVAFNRDHGTYWRCLFAATSYFAQQRQAATHTEISRDGTLEYLLLQNADSFAL